MGRAPCCAKVGLNRGRWSAEEDEILTKYIQTHGEGSWRSLPKKAGLLRCGKSCRLRWVNYLRADLKRGNILQEEEELIVKLHSEMGNRWSLIASKMPGRTDNEIKNYWNTHLSRKLAYSGIDPATHKELSASTSSATAEFLRSRRKRSNKRSATSTKERKTRVTNQQVAATKPSEPAPPPPPPPLPPFPEKTNPDAPVNSNSDSESSKLDDDSLSSLLEELYDPSSSSNQELLTFLDNDLVDCASNDEWLALPAGMEDSPSYGNGLSRSSSSSSCNNVNTEEPEPPAAAAVPAIWEGARSPPLPMEIDVLGISATEQCKSMSISETFDFLMDSDEECDMGMTSCSKATDEVWSFCYFNYHHDDANGQQQQQHQL